MKEMTEKKEKNSFFSEPEDPLTNTNNQQQPKQK